MRGIRIFTVALLIVVAMFVAASPVAAKFEYTFGIGKSYEHQVVVYNGNDISISLRPYIERVEYDIGTGEKFGVRLYYTEKGRESIADGNDNLLNSITNSVMSASEWRQQRTFVSVKLEILLHAKWGRPVVDIEYFYKDLKWFETPYKYI